MNQIRRAPARFCTHAGVHANWFVAVALFFAVYSGSGVVTAAELTNSEVDRVGTQTEIWEDSYVWRAENWMEFEAKVRELATLSLRLVDVEIYVEGDETHYLGLWRPGTGSFGLWTCPTWEAFTATWQKLSMKGLSLIDIEVYQVDGSTMYFGLFREGMSEELLWRDEDWNEVSR